METRSQLLFFGASCFSIPRQEMPRNKRWIIGAPARVHPVQSDFSCGSRREDPRTDLSLSVTDDKVGRIATQDECDLIRSRTSCVCHSHSPVVQKGARVVAAVAVSLKEKKSGSSRSRLRVSVPVRHLRENVDLAPVRLGTGIPSCSLKQTA